MFVYICMLLPGILLLSVEYFRYTYFHLHLYKYDRILFSRLSILFQYVPMFRFITKKIFSKIFDILLKNISDHATIAALSYVVG